MSRLADRYRLLEPIGSGGIGVVHRAEDRATGKLVAVKIMPRPRGATNLRSEFVALARLRHANIVSVFDYGLTEAGHEFFTMELIDGPTLAEAIGPPLDEAPPPRFYDLLTGVLRALAFVHARGMVHADIKPSNILVDGSALVVHPRRAARLADFGLAASATDPLASSARGTVAYAAPEVFAGRLDARSDLYALGVVLYQLTTGAPPYSGGTLRDVLIAQRRSGPADPRQRRPAIPAALAELILALCDPAPGARPQSADEVLARLRELGGGGADLGSGSEPEVVLGELGDALPLVELGGTLVGRDRDLGELRRAWQDARAGRGSAVLLTGEDGIGKSRLAAELKLAVQLDGSPAVVAATRLRADALGTPYAGLDELVRMLLAAIDGDSPTRQHAVREWRRTLAPLLGTAPVSSASSDELGAGERSHRFGLAESMTALTQLIAGQLPLLVVVDDIHLASPAAAELLAYLARAAPEASMLLVLAGRPGRPGSETPAPTAVIGTAIAGAERGVRIDLPPLDRASIFLLAEQAFGRELASRLGDDLFRVSGGNPAYAGRALELLVQEQSILRERGSWVVRNERLVVPLPPTARAALLARVEALPASAAAVLRAAAVLGERFPRDLLAAVAPAGTDLDAALAEATRARLLAADAGAGAFTFSHPELAQALVATLGRDEHDKLHRLAAQHLEVQQERRVAVPAASLAHHYLAIGDRERGARTAIAAATAIADHDPRGALVWLRRARPLVEDLRAAAVDERIGDLESAIGGVDAALVAYEAAHAARAARPGGPEHRIRLARRIGELRRRRGDADGAIAVLMPALDEARTSKLALEEARCHHRIGWVLMYRADYKAAMEHAVAGHLLARSAGDSAAAAELARLRAAIDIYRGDTRSALAILEAALADAEASGDASLTAGILHEIGRAAIHAGGYARAIEALEDAIPTAEAAGDVEQVAKSLNNLGAACYFQGDWARARTSWERFRRLCERIDDKSELCHALNNLGSLYRDLGQLGEAIGAFDRGTAVATAIGHSHLAAMLLANRGEAVFRSGDLAGARDCYDRALGEFRRIDAREDTIETRRRQGELDIATGRTTEGLDRVIEAARDAKDAGARLEEGILHRVAASALRLQGDRESSAWFGKRAGEILDAMGARFERARLDLELGELAAVEGRTADAEKLYGAAAEVFAALGARLDLQGVRVRQRALNRAATPETSSAGKTGLDLLVQLTHAAAAVETDALLELALDRVLAVSGFDRGFILLVDQDGRPRERLRRSRPGARRFDRDEAEFSATIVRRVAAGGEPVSISDVDDEAELRDQTSVVALGLRRIMCAPLRAHGRVIGSIYVDSRRLDLDEHRVDITLLEAIGAQLALAIENTRLAGEDKRKSELMAILAHEIRNPLAGILGYSDLGRHEGKSEPEEARELFGRIRHDAERLRRLVDNVLELARHESGNVEWSLVPLDLAQVIEDVAQSYRVACDRKHIALRVDTSELVGAALGNPDRLAQVLSNLIGNAVKFTSDGGEVSVSARREVVSPADPTAPPIPATEIRAWTPGDDDAPLEFIRVDVRDTGPGMSPELRAHLFEKFTQGSGKKRSSGIGLGLYISREIIQRHGGSIWVDSELGHGATFSFRLQVAT